MPVPIAKDNDGSPKVTLVQNGAALPTGTKTSHHQNCVARMGLDLVYPPGNEGFRFAARPRYILAPTWALSRCSIKRDVRPCTRSSASLHALAVFCRPLGAMTEMVVFWIPDQVWFNRLGTRCFASLHTLTML
jgi:hypothetical protein